MKFPDKYKIMSNNIYSIGDCHLVPIRYEDRLDIMKWRNQQICHLRQKEPLTEQQQDKYFQEVVSKLFDQKNPDQILFSYLEKDKCIGYGGLVHIDWYSKNAEISFIIDPNLEDKFFEYHWKNYLSLLYKYTFNDLDLHKVYTYAFDIRPYLYPALEAGDLVFESRLKEHFLFEGEYRDVVIHSKINSAFVDKNNLYLRVMTLDDKQLLYNWANDPKVRTNAFNSDIIKWQEHEKWFDAKLESKDTYLYIMCDKESGNSIGQIRLDFSEEERNWIISYSIDEKFRGQKLGFEMISLILKKHVDKDFVALVKNDNVASQRVFLKAGFVEIDKNKDYFVYKFTKTEG